MDSDRSGLSYAEHHSGRPLLTPDEVRNLPPSRELLFVAGLRPVLADKLRYCADRRRPRGVAKQLSKFPYSTHIPVPVHPGTSP